MLKFFFDRFSKVVLIMEILGVLFTALWIYKLYFFLAFSYPPILTSVLLSIYCVEYLFLRFCATKRWHPEAKRYEGIELQFKKALIPTSYMMALTSGVGFLTESTLLLWIAVPFMAIILHVNIILLYLHFKDKNTTPINYYSGNKY